MCIYTHIYDFQITSRRGDLLLVTALLSWLTQTITGSGNASTEQPSLALVPVLTLTTASSTATVGGSVMERGDLWLPVKIRELQV